MMERDLRREAATIPAGHGSRDPTRVEIVLAIDHGMSGSPADPTFGSGPLRRDRGLTSIPSPASPSSHAIAAPLWDGALPEPAPA